MAEVNQPCDVQALCATCLKSFPTFAKLPAGVYLQLLALISRLLPAALPSLPEGGRVGRRSPPSRLLLRNSSQETKRRKAVTQTLNPTVDCLK